MTTDDGDTPVTPPSDIDAATAAIRRARSAAKASGSKTTQTPVRRTSYNSGTGEARSGPGPDERDPQPLGRSVQRFIGAQGWDAAAAVAALTGRWAEIVGPDIADHIVVEAFEPEERLLVLRADSTVWATQLRLLSGPLITRLATELGPDVVRTLRILAPATPSRKGQWSVRGGHRQNDRGETTPSG